MYFEYFLKAVFYVIGVNLHAFQKIKKFRVKFPDLPFKTVWSTFFKEEWDSLCVSGLGLTMIELGWFIIHKNNVDIPAWVHDWGIYPIDLLLGYCFQRIIYKALGTAEGVLERKVENLSGKIS